MQNIGSAAAWEFRAGRNLVHKLKRLGGRLVASFEVRGLFPIAFGQVGYITNGHYPHHRETRANRVGHVAWG